MYAQPTLHHANVSEPDQQALSTTEAQAARRRELAATLRSAIERAELEVCYQPVIGLESGALAEFAAILRWPHPQQGLIAPDELLPIAAELALISQLDRLVIGAACHQIQHWRRGLPGAAGLGLSVGISGRLLSEPDLLPFIQGTLAASGLPADALCLEIAEEVVTALGDGALPALRGMRALGVRISLGGFGTRYSSLSHLHQLPIARLTLDRSFIGEIEMDPRGRHVASAVTTLAHALGLQVLGAGVASEAHAALIRSLPCDLGQGDLFARPLSAADAQRLIERQEIFAPVSAPAEGRPSAPQRDPLTGLLSRGMLSESLERAVAHHQDLGRSFALILLDLDFFKSVNDAFGHARGDQILIELARRVLSAVRTSDQVFRYGGDELVLLLPLCDRGQAAALAARLVEGIGAEPFGGEPPLSLSSSMGVAIFPDDATTTEALFEVADQRNYQAKRGGRGRAVCDDRSAPGQPSVEGPARLIDRDQALQICHQFLDEWPDQRRGVLKIVAAPRTGSSRFLAEVEQAARLRGQAVLHLRGTPALKARAYGMFLELREAWPGLPLPSSGPRAFAGALQEQLLRGRDDKLLIIIDSLATADQASLDLIEALFSVPDLQHLAVVYATPRANHGLDLPRQHVLHAAIDLEPLAPVGLRTWLRHSLNWEAPEEFLIWLHAQTGGRPALIRDALAYLLRQEILHHNDGRWHFWADYSTFPLSAKLEQLAARSAQSLPGSPGLFIGREAEIPRLKKLLRQHRLIQLIGPGGVGKSHLAIQTAAELWGTFGDGVYYVKLDTIGSDDFLAYAIAEALGLALTGTRSPAEQLYAYLAPRQLLLVLDNVGSGGDCALLSEIAQRAPQAYMLITTRDRLNIAGLESMPVESLSYPEDAQAQSIEQYSAVQLFVLMARKHLPDFALSDEQRADVARICRLVGGLPLGIELAAAWVRVLSCDAIARQIEENMAALDTARSAAPLQERSMLAMVDSLWNLLSEEERSLLRRMAVFHGGFSAEAAREVIGASLFFLEALVSKGYLCWSRRQHFEAHALLRQYAAALLRSAPAELREAQQRHSGFYLQRLRQPALLQHGSRQIVSAINADLENIRVAWQWAVAQREVAAIFAHIEGLEIFYDLKGSFHEAEATFGAAIRQLREAGPPEGDRAQFQITVGRLYLAQARFLLRLSLYEEARQAAEQAHAINGAVGDTQVEAGSLYHSGTAYWRQGDYQTARRCFTRASALAHQGELLALEADCLRRLSRVTCDMGLYDEARSYGERSLVICRATGARQREARMLNDLGIIADSQGDYQASRAYYEQCLQIYRTIGDLPGEAQALHNLGAGAADQGHYAESEVYLEQALQIFREIGLLHDEAIVIENLGDSARLQGDLARAQTCYQQALSICRAIGDRQGQAFLLANLGLTAHQSGANDSAHAFCGEALLVARAINDRRAEANALLFLGHSLVAVGQLDAAAAAYHEAELIFHEVGQQRLATEPIAGQARICLARGQAGAAAGLIAPILPALAEGGLAGATDPLRVFLTCYQALAAQADPRADGLLRHAIELLRAKAAAIVGDDRRRQLLQTLPAHRALIDAAAGAGLDTALG